MNKAKNYLMKNKQMLILLLVLPIAALFVVNMAGSTYFTSSDINIIPINGVVVDAGNENIFNIGYTQEITGEIKAPAGYEIKIGKVKIAGENGWESTQTDLTFLTKGEDGYLSARFSRIVVLPKPQKYTVILSFGLRDLSVTDIYDQDAQAYVTDVYTSEFTLRAVYYDPSDEEQTLTETPAEISITSPITNQKYIYTNETINSFEIVYFVLAQDNTIDDVIVRVRKPDGNLVEMNALRGELSGSYTFSMINGLGEYRVEIIVLSTSPNGITNPAVMKTSYQYQVDKIDPLEDLLAPGFEFPSAIIGITMLMFALRQWREEKE